jgi:hypothetical protein
MSESTAISSWMTGHQALFLEDRPPRMDSMTLDLLASAFLNA